jgi:hypothetical protein
VHARPRHGPWATCIRLTNAKAENEFRLFEIRTCQLREGTLTEKLGGGGVGFAGLASKPRKIVCQEIRKKEGQGPRRALE